MTNFFQFCPQGKIRQCIARLSRRTVHRQIRVTLNGRPLNTEIFSKRRKIYSFCVDGRDDVSDLTFRQSYQSLTSDKLVCQLRNKKLYSDTMQNTFLAFFLHGKKYPRRPFFMKSFRGVVFLLY